MGFYFIPPTQNERITGKSIKCRWQLCLFFSVFSILAVMLLNCVPASAAKASLSYTDVSIPVAGTDTVPLINQNSKAVYTYTSNNKKVAAVSKKGVIKCLKAGTAKIKVQQTLKKKTTNVGTLTVTVKNASIKKNEPWVIGIGQPGYYQSLYQTNEPYILYAYNYVQFMNPKASYEFYSDNEDLLSIDTNGTVKNTNGTVRDANGTCKVKITIKETYKKKTKTVGSFTMEIWEPSFSGESSLELSKGQTFQTREYITAAVKYYIAITETPEPPALEEIASKISGDSAYEGDSVIKFLRNDDGWNGRLQAAGAGTRYLHYYMYDYTKKEYTKLLGTLKATITESPEAASIQMGFEKHKTSFGEYTDEDGIILEAYTSMDDDVSNVYVEPYKYTGDFEVTSSDETVVKTFFAKYTNRFDYETAPAGQIYFNALNPGTATITVKANGAEKSFKVTVPSKKIETYDDYYGHFYFVYDGEITEDDITFTSSNPSIAKLSLGHLFTDHIDSDSTEGIRLRSINYLLYTYEDSGPVTLTAYCKGTEIFSITLNVED